MAEIRWTREAGAWLEDIYAYIAQDSPDAAARVVGELFNRVQVLADFPRSGYVHRTEPEGEVRVLVYGHYRIAYLVRKTETIEILGIFHGALDMDRYL